MAMRALAPGGQSTAAEIYEAYRAIFEASRDGLIVADLETGRIIAANGAASDMHGYDREALVGLPQTSLIVLHGADSFPEYVSALQAGRVFEGRAVHLRHDGSTFDAELRVSAVPYKGRACVLTSVRDISQQAQTERFLEREVRARMGEQTALGKISRALASALKLQPGIILDQLSTIIHFTWAGLFVLEGPGLKALAVRGLDGPMPQRLDVSDAKALAVLLRRRAPTRIADVWGPTAAARYFRSVLGDQAGQLLQGMHAWMWVPLAVNGRVLGGMGVARAEPERFTAHHADLAQTVANQAAITLVNAQLFEQAQLLAAMQERQRLARNLHDAVNQSLFSAGLIAEVLPQVWERDPAEGRRSLEDLRRLTRGALAELRALLGELRPSVLVESDLGDLLRQLGNALTGRTSVAVKVTTSGRCSLPPDVQVTFYRICQEALSNVGKHAVAGQAAIDLRCEPGSVELRIRDDGRGFDLDKSPTSHTGLNIMRERAASIGAVLSIRSRPGHGTEIIARWTDAGQEGAG
jgi:PAS domain S-box-containing protein